MTLQRRRLTPPTETSASDILDKAEASRKARERPRSHEGCFQKGNQAHINRKARGANRHTQIMREAVIIAMQDCAKNLMTRRGLPYSGVVGYLTWAAEQEPAAFLAFIAKAVLPVQIKHDLQLDQVIEVRFRRIEEVKAEFTRRGLPFPTATFALEHHADISDAVASPAPPKPAQPEAASISNSNTALEIQTRAIAPEVLPPSPPRIPAHLQRYARPPILHRERIEEAADAS
jgi:hypothetical protein